MSSLSKPTAFAPLADKKIFLRNPQNQAVLDGQPERFAPNPKSTLVTMLSYIALALLAALAFFAFVWDEIRDLYLLQVGVPVTATVVSQRTVTHHSKSRTWTTNAITYRFSIPLQDEIYTGEADVGQKIYAQDSTIAVVYAPGNPSISQPASEMAQVPFMTPIFVLGALVGGVIFWKQRRRILRLRSEGFLAKGRIDSCTEHKKHSKGGAYYELVYSFSFMTPDGRSIRGVTKQTFSGREYNRFMPPDTGTPIAVLYVNDRFYEML